LRRVGQDGVEDPSMRRFSNNSELVNDFFPPQNIGSRRVSAQDSNDSFIMLNKRPLHLNKNSGSMRKVNFSFKGDSTNLDHLSSAPPSSEYPLDAINRPHTNGSGDAVRLEDFENQAKENGF